jgi:hypothetical protein
MKRFTNFLFTASFLVTAGLANYSTVIAAPAAPITPATGSTDSTIAEKGYSNLSSFITAMNTGQSGVLTGIYVPGVMAYPVVQQPRDNAGFVSTEPDTLTQFKMASQYGTVGILAHNTLAGANFPNIQMGSRVFLVYGDGSIEQFQVSQIDAYQALSPQSPYSKFVDLEKPETEISATDLFYDVYAHDDQLVLQTCIDNEGNASWGRLFITAQPYDAMSNYFQGSIVKHFYPM